MVFFSVKSKTVKPVIFGMASFLVSQELLRIPILNHILAKNANYIVFQYEHPLLYLLFLSATAGVFEECGRWVFMRVGKTEGLRKGISFGIGHGGMESIFIAGIGCLNIAFTFPPAIWASVTDYLIMSVERFFAIVFHVGLSIIVLSGRERQKPGFLLMAIIVHSIIDFVGLTAVRVGLGNWEIEAILAVVATGFLVSSLYYYTKTCKEERSVESNE